ncbi:Mur ligase family protein [Frigoribacterium salinisoli]
MPEFTLLRPRHGAGATLADLAAVAGLLPPTGDPSGGPRVTSVSVVDREVVPGALFAAVPGRHGHGADHVVAAREAGAVAVLTDPDGADRARASCLPVLVVDDVRAVLGPVAARVHGTDRVRPLTYGVTGTNGKTTTVHVLDALLGRLGVPSGYSSTADRSSGGVVVRSRLTSPEAPELHALLARMVEDGVREAALEVSAQALSRHRVDGLVVDVAGFTNLSHDHLDEYADLDEYLAAKLRLFTPEHARRGVVLLDSPAGRLVAARATVPVTTVISRDASDVVAADRTAADRTDADHTDADWTVVVDELSPDGTALTLTARDGRSLSTRVPLVGRHLAADVALAMVMLLEGGHASDDLARAIDGGFPVTVPGRSLLVSDGAGPRVYTDFSHTPDSVAKTVAALRAVTPGRVIVVLGADGDRDPSKRPLMGRAAADGADLVVVTDHHPRFEDPARIRRGLLAGARASASGGTVLEVADPATAVRHAVAAAREGDTILWVGPGDTDYRVVRGVDVPYSPRRDARAALDAAGWA